MKTIKDVIVEKEFEEYTVMRRRVSPKIVLFKDDRRVREGEVLQNLRIIANKLNISSTNPEGINYTTNELGAKVINELDNNDENIRHTNISDNKNVLVLIDNGFEEVEALTVVDYLRRVDSINVDLVSANNESFVTGSHDIIVKPDMLINDLKILDRYDAVVIPGGMPGASKLRDNKEVINIVQEMNEKGKIISAICAGPIVLERAGILDGKNITSYPGFEEEFLNSNYQVKSVVKDKNIITSRGPVYAIDFSLEIVRELATIEELSILKNSILCNERNE